MHLTYFLHYRHSRNGYYRQFVAWVACHLVQQKYPISSCVDVYSLQYLNVQDYWDSGQCRIFYLTWQIPWSYHALIQHFLLRTGFQNFGCIMQQTGVRTKFKSSCATYLSVEEIHSLYIHPCRYPLLLSALQKLWVHLAKKHRVHFDILLLICAVSEVQPPYDLFRVIGCEKKDLSGFVANATWVDWLNYGKGIGYMPTCMHEDDRNWGFSII